MLLLFSIDGLRPDALLQAATPNIDRLIAEGASTMTAQTLMPCCTLPCHTSMLRGVDVPRHGINTNTFHPLVRPVPSVLDAAHAARLRVGMFINWGQLRDLCEPDSTVVFHFTATGTEPHGDLPVADAAVAAIEHDRLDFAFVYFGCVDEVGHVYGWMSDEYLRAAEEADSCVGQVLAAAPGSNVILLSDHGGHERTHGTELPEDMTIPFVVAGPGIRSGHTLSTAVRIDDTAPTAARILGIPIPREWERKPVDECFLP